MNTVQDIERLQAEFSSCQQVLTALGDETRQYLLSEMLSQRCGGCRVVELARRTNLSRPAISHHVQVLKSAGIVKARKEGTRIYYYLEPSESEMEKLYTLVCDMKRVTEGLPDRSGNK